MSPWMRLCLLAAAGAAPVAGASTPLVELNVPGRGAPGVSAPMQIVLLLTLLALLPAVVVSVTPFLRITVVLHFLRQALGTQSTPSNQVLIGLALFLTLLVMQPVGSEIYQKAWAPLEKNQITLEQAFEAGSQPLKNFLLRFAREKDIALFVELTKSPAPRTPADLDLKILIPAYILSELKAGFQIGAVLFFALPGDRFSGGFSGAVGGHCAVAAGDDLGPVQDPAVRAGGRLEPDRGRVDEDVLFVREL